MAQVFTVFEKFGSLFENLSAEPELQKDLAAAVMLYGSLGVEPEFDNPVLAAFFELVRGDIDYSVNNHANGKKGGRPRKETKAETEENPYENPPHNQTQNPTNNPTPEKPETIKIKKEIEKEIKKKREGAKKFAPPSREEALAYKAEAGLDSVDVDRFLDYYEANGWVQARGKPIKDWRAAMRNWDRRQNDYGPKRPPGEEVNELAAKYANAW